VAADRKGNLYVADSENNAIRKVSPSGQVTTLAGIVGERPDYYGAPGRFFYPTGIAVDGDDNVYVADNGIISKIDAHGTVTAFAQVGGASAVATDSLGNVYVQDGNLGVIQRFTPEGVATTVATGLRYLLAIAVATDGTLYVSDGQAIKKISPAGVVTKLAGEEGERGYQDGPGFLARFDTPSGLTVDGGGNVYVADDANFVIRKIAPDGQTSTVAGRPGNPEFADGERSQARFYYPRALTLASDGNLYVADSFNHSIRKVTLDGIVTTVAGAGGHGSVDGVGSNARFSFAGDIPFSGITGPDAAGNLYVSDTYNDTIRKITPAGVVTTVAGFPGAAGNDDGVGSSARFSQPEGIALGPNGELYVADTGNGLLRRIAQDGLVTTLLHLARPVGVAVDDGGNLFVTDLDAIRKITPSLVVTTIATLTQELPTGIAIGPEGKLYVAAWFSKRIVTVTQDGTVVTLAGGLAGTDAQFGGPAGIAVDALGNAWVTDSTSDQISRITRDGVVTTVAGSGGRGSADGTGGSATFASPSGITIDGNGDLYVVDTLNDTVRKGVPSLSDVATIDATTGYVGARRQLNAPAAPNCEWKIIRYPATSQAQLSSATSCSPTFTPDVADVYVFQLTASDGARSRISTVTLTTTGRERRRAARH
jgi:sugar lactone lactonase YvrE